MNKSQICLCSFCIYTKTGDNGTSSLYDGQRRPKSDDIFGAMGDVDELNSLVGLAREHCAALDSRPAPVDCETSVLLSDCLEEIQSRLFDIGAAIATPSSSASERKVALTRFDTGGVARLEGWIDEIDATLPPLRNFILPSGGMASATLHLARTVCRRAERRVVQLAGEGGLEHSVLVYMNRLSDFLFVAARRAALLDGKPETIWKKAAAPPEAPSAE